MVCRFSRKIDVTPETLAYEVTAGVGPGGNFLIADQTVMRCHTEFWQPSVCDRDGLEAWMNAGQPDAVSRAHSRWHVLVTDHEDPPLDGTTARQLQSYVEKNL